MKHLLDQYLLQTEGGLHCKILPALNLAAGVKSGGDLRGRQGGRGEEEQDQEPWRAGTNQAPGSKTGAGRIDSMLLFSLSNFPKSTTC